MSDSLQPHFRSTGVMMEGLKVFVLNLGHRPTANTQKEFMRRLAQKVWINEVPGIQACDITIVFCPIVSRVGTDIEAALKKIPDSNKPVILAVLHPTLDRDYVVPNTRKFVQGTNVTILDFLFSEEGLLTCSQNDAALATLVDILKSMLPPRHYPVRDNSEWLDSLLFHWCLLLPLSICLAVWDQLTNSLGRRPALRNRFKNRYFLPPTALFIWLVIIIATFKILFLFFAAGAAIK